MTLSEHRPGIFFIVVGPAGAGKNRLIETIITRTEDLQQLPTATTRPMRSGEQQGREHVFVSMEEFDRFIEIGALLEHQLVHGVNYYGILREKVEVALYNGALVIADIEVKGSRAAREAYPDNVVTIFVQPPSVSSLVDRMRIRKEQDAEIARRLMRVPMELEYASEADYVVVNDDLEHAATTFMSIITAERSRRVRLGAAAQLEYHYAAQVIPIYEGESLRRSTLSPYPHVTLNEGEPPHVAAARALNIAFGAAVPAGEWLYGKRSEDDDFLPPITVQTANAQGQDQIVFVYHYRLTEKITPPEAWQWTALPAAPEVERNRA